MRLLLHLLRIIYRAELDRVKAALQDTQVEVEKWTRKEREASFEGTILRSKLDEAYRTADRCRGELAKDVGGLQERLSQTELRARRSEAHAADLERALAVAQDERRKTAALLETKSAELREAHAYLDRLDDTTDSDVLTIVEKLNSTIFQTAATIADAFQDRYHRKQGVELAEQACARLEASGLLNADLGMALRFAEHGEDCVLVQTALQTVIASYGRWVCATWDFGIGDGASVLHEPQSVAGKWRSLSRTHVKAFVASEEGRQAVAEGMLAEHVTDILLACGVHEMPQRLLDEVKGKCSEALHEIVRLALEFQRITGECIVSRDLFVVLAKDGVTFDPDRMTDEWATPRQASRVVDERPVLCTTQLGVVREDSRGNVGGQHGPEVSATILLKPKVVLTSMLNELWNEQARASTPRT
ncbi:hypothetical protein C8Q76DRAFT_779067 [Earliella scabrosa]|nr:hypothetical protein C8Q76DRAFT_779067 [Earliella scabrosa]